MFNLHHSTLQHNNKHNIHPHQGQRNNQNKQKVNHPTPLDTNLKLGFTTTHRKLDHQNKNNNSNNKSKLQATKLRQIYHTQIFSHTKKKKLVSLCLHRDSGRLRERARLTGY